MSNRSVKPLADTLSLNKGHEKRSSNYGDAPRSDQSVHGALDAKNPRVALLTTCPPTVVFDCSCVFVATRPLIGTSIRVSVCTSCRQQLPIATDTTSIRRHKEAQTIYDIANHLPLGKDQLERANQSILLRLAVQYIKLRRVFRDTFRGIVSSLDLCVIVLYWVEVAVQCGLSQGVGCLQLPTVPPLVGSKCPLVCGVHARRVGAVPIHQM